MRPGPGPGTVAHMDSRGVGRWLLGAVGVVAAITAWTAAALPFLAVAAFATVDASCDGPPEVQFGVLWWPAGVVAIWLGPFVGAALWRRSVTTTLFAVAAVVVASTVVLRFLLEPSPFCF